MASIILPARRFAPLLGAFVLVFSAWGSTAQEVVEQPLQIEEADTSTPDSAGTAPDSSAPPVPDVGLDQLLRLPNTLDFKEERRQGADSTEWRRRFRQGRQEVAKAETKLARIMNELDQTSTEGAGQWQIAPPGAKQTEVSPLSFRLREELRRARKELEETERRFRALNVEADLASVPADWRVQPKQ